MAPIRSAYLPLATYPEPAADQSIRAAVGFAGVLAQALRVTTLAVDVPRVTSALGNLLIDVPGLVRGVEERSAAECARLEALVREAAQPPLAVEVRTRRVAPASALDAAAAEARYHDLAVLAGGAAGAEAQDLAQAVVFGSGRPTVLVPPSASPAPVSRLAIAWDGSRVAARALGDALPLLAAGARVSVLTVRDEKPLAGEGIAAALAAALGQRGIEAAPLEVSLGKRTIATALQEAAQESGAQLLAMGGFGHSRLRDFVLGGATRGIIGDLRLPTLLSH